MKKESIDIGSESTIDLPESDTQQSVTLCSQKEYIQSNKKKERGRTNYSNALVSAGLRLICFHLMLCAFCLLTHAHFPAEAGSAQ